LFQILSDFDKNMDGVYDIGHIRKEALCIGNEFLDGANVQVFRNEEKERLILTRSPVSGSVGRFPK
jgi:hypothetical protein